MIEDLNYLLSRDHLLNVAYSLLLSYEELRRSASYYSREDEHYDHSADKYECQPEAVVKHDNEYARNDRSASDKSRESL